ncbi:beta-ketoacyl synthase chain length factor [Candidatus Marinarcus aquaticus]|uniref:Beta-ketoacyl synthase-like N-terminal domain-containing protein n=1 Tax=Candidatus Marinarcus aquaticus TaxID=2044504 RepID=A0A4Q0XUK9_9BACT|nr:beta-ketoacyl synthase chain length factor [Candidatus Marinarcus aquaticus]RXJ57863.1 hypothetical protein CRV04_04980 [Candidatus Marinarcus aquaticus]
MKINLEITNAAYMMDKECIEELRTKELVPKMVFRRRLTKAAKFVVELIDKVKFEQGRIMYASAFGELPATANILHAILHQEGISPTDFQNSVYNTPVSYASILQNNKHEILTISCGDNSSDRLLKLGAIKALDGDEILLLATETLNIVKIEEVNECIDFLECAVVLKVKVTQDEATHVIKKCKEKVPASLELLIGIAQTFDPNQRHIIEVKL